MTVFSQTAVSLFWAAVLQAEAHDSLEYDLRKQTTHDKHDLFSYRMILIIDFVDVMMCGPRPPFGQDKISLARGSNDKQGSCTALGFL